MTDFQSPLEPCLDPCNDSFDLQPLLEIVNGDPILLRSLLVIFLKDAKATSETLEIAISHADYHAIKELAHGLKGICSVLKMHQVQENAVSIEAMALERGDITHIQKCYHCIQSMLSRAMLQINEYVNQPS